MPRAALVAAAALCVAALTSCSDEDGGAPDAAATPTTGSSSAPASGSPSGPGAEEERLIAAMERGIGERGSATVLVRTSGMVRSTSRGVVAYDGSDTRVRMTSVMRSLGSARTRILVAEGSTYVSAPGVTPPGRYLALDQGDPRLQQWTGGSSAIGPQESLAGFREGLRDVQEVGHERIDGVSTTRYRLEVDARAALEAQGGAAPPAMPQLVSYDVWLDDRDRIRRTTTEVAGSRVLVEFRDWGRPVSIQPPPPSAVVRPPD